MQIFGLGQIVGRDLPSVQGKCEAPIISHGALVGVG